MGNSEQGSSGAGRPPAEAAIDLRKRVATLAEQISDEVAAEDVDWGQVRAWIDELAHISRATFLP